MEWKKILIYTGIGLVTYAGMRYLLPPAVPFFLGWCLASAVLPAAKWLEKHLYIHRGIGGGCLIGVLVVILGWSIWKLMILAAAQGKLLLQNIGLWRIGAEELMCSCCLMVEKYLGIQAADTRSFLLYQLGRMQEEIQNKFGGLCVEYLVTVVRGVTVFFGGVLVTIIFGIFVIKDMDEFRSKIRQGQITGILASIGNHVLLAGGRYLKAQVYLMGIVILVCMAGFWILENPYFIIAGIVVGALDALPLIGAGMILIPWALLWLIRGKYLLALGYLLLYFAADLLRQFLEPRMLGKEMGMHPALMLASVYIGFFVYGFAGFLLGPATVLIVRVAAMEILNKKDMKKPQKS